MMMVTMKGIIKIMMVIITMMMIMMVMIIIDALTDAGILKHKKIITSIIMHSRNNHIA